MADIWMDVDAALAEVPVNIMPLLDDTDFKSREVAITYDQAGMDLVWNFVTTAGATTQTAVTPTTGGDYDWAHQGDAMYTIEIPASGGASINNDTEGFGWFTGFATGVLPWRGPVIGFRASGLNDLLIDSAYSATRGLGGTALPDAAADAAGGLPISDAGGLDLDTQIATDIDAILADTNELQADDTPGAIAALNDPTAAAIADAVWDEASAGHTGAGKAGEQLWTDLDAVLADTNELQADDTPAAIAALNDPTAAAIADAVWDEDVVAAHNGADSAGALIDDIGTKADFKADVAALATAAAVAVAQADLDNPNQYKANVAGLATAAAVAAAQADLDNPNQYKATGFSTLSAAQINTEVVDGLNGDTYAEPGQGDPSAIASIAAMISYLYKLARNKVTQTATELNLYNNAGDTVDQKAAVSDDGTTYTRGKIGSGP